MTGPFVVRFSLARRLQLRVSALNLEQGYLRVCPYTKSHSLLLELFSWKPSLPSLFSPSSLPVAFTWVSWQLKLSTACLKNRRPACAVWALRTEALRGAPRSGRVCVPLERDQAPFDSSRVLAALVCTQALFEWWLALDSPALKFHRVAHVRVSRVPTVQAAGHRCRAAFCIQQRESPPLRLSWCPTPGIAKALTEVERGILCSRNRPGAPAGAPLSWLRRRHRIATAPRARRPNREAFGLAAACHSGWRTSWAAFAGQRLASIHLDSARRLRSTSGVIESPRRLAMLRA